MGNHNYSTINTQTTCLDGFEIRAKHLMMEDITVIFEKMLKKHEESIVKKNQKMFHKQEQSILVLISGNSSLKNQGIDSLSKDINNFKESLEFSKNDAEGKFKNMGDKV